MQEFPSDRTGPRPWWHLALALLACALCALGLWRLFGPAGQPAPAFVPPSHATATCWVRAGGDLQRLAELGFEDAHAWEVGAAEDGWLTTTLTVSEAEGVQVRVPLEAGTTALVWYRLQLARSGMNGFLDIKQPLEAGEYGWLHPADRWTPTLTVLFPRVPAFTDGVSFAANAVRGLGSELEYFSRINQGPLPYRFVDGPRASVSISCSPRGALAIPATARVAGMTVGVLPMDAWAPLPTSSKPAMLQELEWATRGAAGERPVGTWTLGLTFEPVP